jgi:hypothetical protein
MFTLESQRMPELLDWGLERDWPRPWNNDDERDNRIGLGCLEGVLKESNKASSKSTHFYIICWYIIVI